MHGIYAKVDRLELFQLEPLHLRPWAGWSPWVWTQHSSVSTWSSAPAWPLEPSESQCSSTIKAFVRMVGHHAALLEAHVCQAERDHGAFPQALRRWLGSAGFPSFRNVSICPPK
ncbi:hypothetical protein GHT09_018911 [Marmota monax]|uniref:Uncharacterized protein n=1 Tax=Marmota monax TaxID=9995 RepID=A0A834Q5P3_MARMO|nr:hypothetical protein GHT09_018911 [Marmota monax]